MLHHQPTFDQNRDDSVGVVSVVFVLGLCTPMLVLSPSLYSSSLLLRLLHNHLIEKCPDLVLYKHLVRFPNPLATGSIMAVGEPDSLGFWKAN